MNFKNLFYVSVFTLLAFSSCKNDDDEAIGSEPQSTRIEISLSSLTGDEEIGANGYTPYTIDELYHLCETVYLPADTVTGQVIQYIDSLGVLIFAPENVNIISFNVSDQGIIKTCGYTPEGCMDDCFRGFTISAFETLD